MLVMTRRLYFTAAHRELPDSELTGNTYILDVAVSGLINERTGLLVNIKELDRIVKERVLNQIDGKYLNGRIPFFQTQPATPENIATYIAETILPFLPSEVQLHSIRLQPTPVIYTEWFSQLTEAAHMLLTKIYEFSASHRLHSDYLSEEENRDLFGKCNNPNGHGHNYELEVTICGPINPTTGRVLPPECLDAIVEREVLSRYDHRYLNLDVPEFAHVVPSAEMIVKTIWERLRPCIPTPARLYRLRLYETPRNLFEYSEEDDKE
ncbi:MAG TPA: 6-carboxytetrahydropterin synthase [Chthonomonas sp.]|uniref:6-carboxytetrahydropterin synthase n=1 Tax=Chthonomonas sp. TaxID=2282153 RepID=UPI002B4AE002|nr:6-carboxytetrahydropterin synthase [Chthonomonas sp.]HLI48416.1 6-carboxytetrahydropterin synthase [Chthonomonas sp.]